MSINLRMLGCIRPGAATRTAWTAVHNIFVVTEWIGQPANVCNEHTEIKWFTLDEMLHLANIVDCEYPRHARMAIFGRGSPESGLM